MGRRRLNGLVNYTRVSGSRDYGDDRLKTFLSKSLLEGLSTLVCSCGQNESSEYKDACLHSHLL